MAEVYAFAKDVDLLSEAKKQASRGYHHHHCPTSNKMWDVY
jgi:hypothetical protein